MENETRSGFVVQDDTPPSRRFYVVCDTEAESVALAKASVGSAALRVLRPMAAWEITVFGLVDREVRPAP
jgi:hypothetical protein